MTFPFYDYDSDFFSTEDLLFLAGASGKAVEDTATGNPLTFQTDIARPLKSLLIPFTPVQSGTGDPSPQNIRSILPWNGLTVWNGGKNLFNGTNVINGYFAAQGSDTIIYSASAGRTVWCPCKPDTVYAVSKMTGGKRLSVYVSEEEPKVNTVVYSTQRISGSGTDVYVFRTPSNVKYICAFVWLSTADTDITAEQMISSVQIEAGQTATAYEPFKPITETDIVFPSPVYGGQHEAVSGKLMDGWDIVDLGSLDWTVASNGDIKWFYSSNVMNAYPIESSSVLGHIVSDRYKNVKASDIYSDAATNDSICVVYSNQQKWMRFRVKATEYNNDTQAFKTAMNGAKVAYQLETPQEIQLTPQQITALVGDNTIWSDADGEMTATYLKKG